MEDEVESSDTPNLIDKDTNGTNETQLSPWRFEQIFSFQHINDPDAKNITDTCRTAGRGCALEEKL